MVKRVLKLGNTTLFSKEDRAYLVAFEKSSQSHVKKATRSREAAMQELIDSGIYGSNRKLKKHYRSIA